MRNRARVFVVAMALTVSACGAGAVGSGTTTTTTAAETTNTSAPRATTSTTALSTTTTASTTGAGYQSLMAALEEGEAELISGRMDGAIEISGLDDEATGVSQASILFGTAFNATGDYAFWMDMSSFAGALEVDDSDPFAGLAEAFLGETEIRQIGDRAFMKFPFFTSMMGAGTDWVSMPAEEGSEYTEGFKTVPSDPQDVLEAYEGAEASVEDLGLETVNGVATTHYRIVLDTEAMDITDAERAELEASGLFADGVIPMDLWVAEAGYLVRMLLVVDGTGVDAAPGEEFETMTIRYDLSDINGDVAIEAPPASEVTHVEDLEGLDFDFGG